MSESHQFTTTLHRQPGIEMRNVIAAELESQRWKRLDVAVAWVKHSGMRYIMSPLSHFLAMGGEVRIVVGTDLQGTSVEGLRDLQTLAHMGSAQIFVRAPSPATTFHVKLLLFRSEDEAKLVVGSSNFTEGGLVRNFESSLEISAGVTDTRIMEAIAMLDAFSDTSGGRVRVLNPGLIAEMARAKIAVREHSLRREQTARAMRANLRLGPKRIFAPPPSLMPRHPPPSSVLLFRPRRHRGGTQAQIPFRLFDLAFFAGTKGSTNRDTGTFRPFVRSSGRGGRNTIKLELSESAGMREPIVRFIKRKNNISHEIRESTSSPGSDWKQAIQEGFASTPRLSMRSIGDKRRATWWRFV